MSKEFHSIQELLEKAEHIKEELEQETDQNCIRELVERYHSDLCRYQCNNEDVSYEDLEKLLETEKYLAELQELAKND